VRSGSWLCLLAPAAVAALAACRPIPHREPRQQELKPQDVAVAVAGDREFAGRLFAQVALPDQNAFLSPASVRMALTMTWVGARGDTASEMKHALAYEGDPLPISYAWRGLRAYWMRPSPKGESFTLRVANGFFSNLHQQFSPGYLELCASRYDAPLARLDFRGAAETSRLEINRWVEKHTDGKITDLLDAGAIDPDTRLILINAVYFKAAWASPFDPSLTHEGDFTLADGKKVKAKLMSRTGPQRYAETDNVQVLELPYQGDGFVMDVLLPRGDIKVLEASLGDRQKLDDLLAPLAQTEIDVLLPRFELKSRYDLVAPLKKLGMTTAFERGKADFSGMDGEHDLFIDFVVHQSYVKVDEHSTEAAAATAVASGYGAAPPSVTAFHADHPFLFLIRDTKRGALLFMGRLANPSG
jgi:serine protease inhibitor